MIVKHGCALVPAVAARDAAARGARDPRRRHAHARPRHPAAGTSAKSSTSQEAGRVESSSSAAGITRVEADDGTLAAAWVVALETPYYAITDDAGRFRIDELAAGTYDLSFLLPPLPSVVDGKLSYGAPVIVHRAITVGTARTARLDVALGH